MWASDAQGRGGEPDLAYDAGGGTKACSGSGAGFEREIGIRQFTVDKRLAELTLWLTAGEQRYTDLRTVVWVRIVEQSVPSNTDLGEGL